MSAIVVYRHIGISPNRNVRISPNLANFYKSGISPNNFLCVGISPNASCWN